MIRGARLQGALHPPVLPPMPPMPGGANIAPNPHGLQGDAEGAFGAPNDDNSSRAFLTSVSVTLPSHAVRKSPYNYLASSIFPSRTRTRAR